MPSAEYSDVFPLFIYAAVTITVFSICMQYLSEFVSWHHCNWTSSNVCYGLEISIALVM